jgi:hypothetical protein
LSLPSKRSSTNPETTVPDAARVERLRTVLAFTFRDVAFRVAQGSSKVCRSGRKRREWQIEVFGDSPASFDLLLRPLERILLEGRGIG